MNRPPNSKVNLDRAIQRLYGTGARFVEYRSIIANTIVGQFLPDGVVKGGSALKLRYGCLATRMTTDFDTAYRTNIDEFIESVRKGLEAGWGDFTGGVPCNQDKDYNVDPDSVSCSRSFGEQITTMEALMESIASFTAQAATKLRKHGVLATGCNVYAQVAVPGMFEVSPEQREPRSGGYQGCGGGWDSSFYGGNCKTLLG